VRSVKEDSSNDGCHETWQSFFGDLSHQTVHDRKALHPGVAKQTCYLPATRRRLKAVSLLISAKHDSDS
jgi:hypothetical protein